MEIKHVSREKYSCLDDLQITNIRVPTALEYTFKLSESRHQRPDHTSIFFLNWCLTMAQFLLKFSSRELRFLCHDVECNFTTIIYFVLTPIPYTSAEYSWSVTHQLIFHWDCRYLLIIFFTYKHVILRSFDDQALQRYYKLKSAKANYGNIKYIKTLWTI